MLPTDSKLRKEAPMFSGVLDYFPDAIFAVARLSFLGNEKHNPGEPLHWAKGKSMDEPDCIMRHLADHGIIDPDDGALHEVKLAWRSLANLQRFIDKNGIEACFDEKRIAAIRAERAARVRRDSVVVDPPSGVIPAEGPDSIMHHPV
jgi:hypothetical protein